MRKNLMFIGLIFTLFAFCSCSDSTTDQEEEIEKEVEQESDGIMSEIDVPDDFDFKTSKEVSISFGGTKMNNSNSIKYTIYLYDEEYTESEITYTDEAGEEVTANLEITNALNNKIASVVTDQSSYSMNVTIPESCKSLYVVKNEMGIYSSSIIAVNGTKASFYKSATKSAKESAVDIFYGVNGSGELFTINEATNELTVIDKLPDNTGSYTCAIDPVSRKLYTIGNNYPKYSLYCYDIDKGSWTTQGSIRFGGPRLGYNRNDGLLYFSTWSYVYALDPSSGKKVASYKIYGLQSNSGGDLTFDADGVMYISSTTGLYRCDFNKGNTIDATWISSESLPNYPNSLTFDSKDELWWATAIGNEGLNFIMDKVTGGWEARSTYNTLIHDLATLPYDEDSIEEVDTDNDGIIDFYDEFPEDADKATTTYTPSIYGWGTYAFEDLWPYKGDYDFNDLVVNYRYTNIENAEGEIVETKLNYVIKNIGGSLKNGFGIQLNMNESLIKEVTGYNLTEGIIKLNDKGLEADQSLPVIIAFDNAWANGKESEFEILITYNDPIDELGDINPFIFINKERGREVHCSNMEPTDLMDQSLLSTSDDKSDIAEGKYYKDKYNLPWGIDIIHDFAYPKEKSEVVLGYPYFKNWAESGGSEYDDWYKEKTGYRNYNYLEQN
nr:LruC domain-containing protein [uncultured Marinifilum sp.]